jgi:phospholipase C
MSLNGRSVSFGEIDVKHVTLSMSVLLWLGTAAFAQITDLNPPKIPYPNPLKHVVLVIQENRTPDNLFQTLLTYPGINSANYDLAPGELAEVNGQDEIVALTPRTMITDYDPGHSHGDFETMWNSGKMDGANSIPDACIPGSVDCQNNGLGEFLSYKYVQASDVGPYLQMAVQYGWANYMFQTNQGASFDAHQYLFSATSSQTAEDDAEGVFIAGIPYSPPGANYLAVYDTGCLAPLGELNSGLSPQSAPNYYAVTNDPLGTFCFQHDSVATLLDGAQLSWKYYAVLSPDNPNPNNPSETGYNPQGYMFTAPNSIYDICMPDYTQNPPVCTSAENTNNIDLKPSDVLTDIAACNLPSVAWVTPIGPDSDHPGNLTGDGGPSWVASIVNAIGTDAICEQGAGYWSDTAILVVWDDWGGWSDHVPPTILPTLQGDYELGFRVPFLAISAYTPQAYISNYEYDFGSIVRFTEGVFGFPEGSLGFSDARAATDLSDFFDFNMSPRPFQMIAAKYDREHFLHEPLQAEPPDDY